MQHLARTPGLFARTRSVPRRDLTRWAVVTAGLLSAGCSVLPTGTTDNPPASVGTGVQAAPGVAHGTTFYVSPSGNDKNAGTSTGTAWRSIAAVTGRDFMPGDSILFEGGKTFAGSLFLDGADAGTPAAPVTISSYGTGRATLSAGSARGIFVYNAGGIRITNLRIVGAGRTVNTAEGVFVYTDLPSNVKLDYLRLDSLDVSGFGTHGILIGSGMDKSGFRDVRITNVKSHDNALSGLTIYGKFSSTATTYAHSNVYLGHVMVYDNPGKSGLSFNSGSGINISDVDTGTLERSVAYRNGALNTANGGPVGIWVWDSNLFTIQYNESHDNHTASATDGGGFDFDGGTTNSIMQYNYSHDNDGAGFLLSQFSGARPSSGSTIRYNISQNDGRRNGFGAIHVGAGITNADIYQNTVYLNAPASGTPRAFYLTGASTNIRVRNNILMTAGGMRLVEILGSQAGLLMQGNDYWASGASFRIRWNNVDYGSLSAWRSASGLERMGIVPVGFAVDPKLTAPGAGGAVNNADLLNTLGAYRLQTASAMIDAGLNLLVQFGINPGPQDFYGTITPQGLFRDIGADEAPAVLPPPSQLVVNPGFESGSTGWFQTASGGRSIVTTQFHSGLYSQEVLVSAFANRQVYQGIPVTAGKVYSASAWVKTSGIASGNVQVQLLWLNAAGLTDNPPSANVLRTDVLGSFGGSSLWTQATGTYTAPPGAVQLRLRLYVLVNPSGTGSAWFDDLSVLGQ